jgi:hypothetical protein
MTMANLKFAKSVYAVYSAALETVKQKVLQRISASTQAMSAQA